MKDSATHALFHAPPPINLSTPRVRHYLQHFELEKLFIEELGWDRHAATLEIPIDSHVYTLRGFAEKRGVQIFLCMPDGEGEIPDYATRRKIEKKATKAAYEHLIIYIDRSRTTQVWQWVSRQPGRPAACREHTYHPDLQTGDALISKLKAIAIPLNEEEAIDLAGAVQKLRDVFDRDLVTKRFYDHFKREHAAFLKFVKGIVEKGDQAWYASLMLNRLMFVYFIQGKGFLDGDMKYLANRLRAVQSRKGKGQFHTFYRYFLLALFQEGFNKRPEARRLDPDLKALLGDVPFLNGGLFELHELETKYPDIDIPDEAFENIFVFFGQYDWTLDTRPLKSGREINPDVLGYIFEKYINQKQMGAYYTKEDITGYIGRNTIIPCLFDTARKKCAVAFQGDAALWRLLRDDPDRYIYPAMRRGVIDPTGAVIPESVLPDFVQRGMHDPKARMFDRDYNLGQAFIPDEQGFNLAMPTETWREYANRRARCLEIRDKLADGGIREINDLITCNLDIRQFAEDAVVAAEGPELLRAFWQAIAGKIPERSNERFETGLTILDPTCGSGAFLFAALNILEPLYEACMERMQAFVDDMERSGAHHSPRKFEDFRKILADVERHPNRSYFILKSIIVNNLYGVDIMEEAVEICKLRLFLKLVAQIDRVKELEPLPDIDFNIRAGNTLVGFVSLEEIRSSAEKERAGDLEQVKMLYGQADDAIKHIEESAEIVDRAFRLFHRMQTESSMDAAQFAESKHDLRKRLKSLTEQLDRYLAAEYGIDLKKQKEYDRWRKSHQPFHWFAEFYGIMSRGGFDVIIGNPPYVEYKDIKKDYSVKGYYTEGCADLYAFVLERALNLAGNRGGMGMIIPVSIVSTDGFDKLRTLLLSSNSLSWNLNFAERPSKLFNGVEKRLTIWILSKGNKFTSIYLSNYQRWFSQERETLFHRACYVLNQEGSSLVNTSLPKLCSKTELNILHRFSNQRTIKSYFHNEADAIVYYTRKLRYFVQFYDFVPIIKDATGNSIDPSELKKIYVATEDDRDVLIAILNSNLFFWFFTLYSDVRNVNRREIEYFRCSISLIPQDIVLELRKVSKSLMQDFVLHAKNITSRYGNVGTLTIQSFQPRKSKSIIDSIDVIISKHYGFTDEELDFIINYDIKYRMGQSGKDEEPSDEI
jgi:methylase of polypeptide subunit release factors